MLQWFLAEPLTTPGAARYFVGAHNYEGAQFLYRLPMHNIAGTGAPTASNDASANYAPGSIWVDRTNDVVYVCVDNTSGAAVWERMGDVDGGSP